MVSPAFIVEGQMEQRIIAQICSGQPIRRINCNGDDVAIARVCDFIETQIRTLGNRNYPIIVLFDRENRQKSAQDIIDEVVKILNDRGLGDQDIRVFVADRETEDWYLKDCDSIYKHYGIPLPIVHKQGKRGLAGLLQPVVDYHETSIGVDLFSIVSKRRIAEACPIFSRLVKTAQEIECDLFLEDNLI